MSSSAAPTRPARTAAASGAMPGCSPACRSRSRARSCSAIAAAGSTPSSWRRKPITCGEGEVFVAGGVESMSRAPFVMNKAESAFGRDGRDLRLRRSARAFRTRRSSASSAPTRCPRPPTTWRATTRSPARPATSSPRARSANTPPARPTAFSSGEIFAVEVPGGRAGPVKVGEDEHPRPQTDLAALARLRPLAEGGVTTAGNASGINDGAVAMIVASRKAGDAAGAEPLARVRRQRRRRGAAAGHGHRPGRSLEKGAGPRRARASPTST